MSPSKKSAPRALFGVLSALCLTGAAAVALSSACKIEPDAPKADRQQMLQDLTANVIVASYSDVATQCEQLASALAALRAAPSADTLRNAQQLYRSARATQKSTEAFFYGPADDVAVTGGAIDAWPADAAKLDALLRGSDPITPSDVSHLGATQRGFPALEYVLFDSSVGDDVVLARFTQPGSGARRLELSESLARDLASVTRRVSDSFSGPNGYANELATAGIGSKTIPEQSKAVDTVVTGLLYAAELVEMKKLAKPLGIDNNKTTNTIVPAAEEGPRSDSSIADIASDLAGIRAIYSGTYGSHVGTGVGTAVRDMNPGADARFLQALAAADAAVAAIPAPFRLTLLQNPAPIMSAATAVQAVQDSIKTDVAGTLGASLGFGFSDSD
ncbi:MAG: Iron-regulated protein precursor [Myxococcaceae bacterium]|nr:Iron-regulated protein precursor [Myxococcaceae bacterium]